MASQTVENYLKALLSLADEDGKVNSTELSRVLKVSKPTTNSMVKKLHKDGLVIYQRYRPLQLTEKGKKAAALVLRKHRLTEMYLVDKMKFGWEEVHAIAEQMEHIKSQAFFDRMDELLGFPNIDPHGSPIPDREGNVITRDYKTLSDCMPGDQVTLTSVRESSSELLQYLNKRGISLGLAMEVTAKEAFDDSMTVLCDGNENLVLSKSVCEQLLVNDQ